MKNGLTGILRPNGTFIKCNYGDHCKISINIPEEEELKCIYFSSNLYDIKSSLLFISDKPTKLQLNWISLNISKLDLTQLNMWNDYKKLIKT